MKTMSEPLFKNKYKTFLFFFVLANVNALLNFSVIVSTMLVEGETPDFLKHTIFELTGSYSFFVLTPLMLLLFNKVPLKKEKLWFVIPIYFIAVACLGVMHTYIMFTSRSLIFNLAGWGFYDFGYFPYRILMESLKLLLGFWIFCGAYNFVKVYKARQAENLRAVQLEEELSKSKLLALQSQLNPHFLFNTLNMISSTMYEDINAADMMIANLSDLLRITLKGTSKGEHKLKNEIELLNLYNKIMKARFKDKLEIEINIAKETEEAFVPSFLFQPLIENSIKYGMENLSNTKVELVTQKVNDRLLIKIKDNGPGINKDEAIVLNGGIGLSNTVERLEKLYGNRFEFNWKNLDEGGIIFTIEIPFKEEGKEN